MNKPLSCIVCKKELESALTGSEIYDRQPAEALSFIAYGNYGSTVFDPMPISGRVVTFLTVNICDKCILVAVTENTVQEVTKTERSPSYEYKNFDPNAPQGY